MAYPCSKIQFLWQGIKFYSPEVAGQSPEAVEFKGISNLVEAVKPNLLLESDRVRVFDAAAQASNNIPVESSVHVVASSEETYCSCRLSLNMILQRFFSVVYSSF